MALALAFYMVFFGVREINRDKVSQSTCINYMIKKKIKFSSYTYKEIQSGAVAKSYMRKDFQICEEMRKYFPIYEEAVSHI